MSAKPQRSPIFKAEAWRFELKDGDRSIEGVADFEIGPTAEIRIVPLGMEYDENFHLLWEAQDEYRALHLTLVGEEEETLSVPKARVTQIGSAGGVGQKTQASVTLTAYRGMMRRSGSGESSGEVKQVQYRLTGLRQFRTISVASPFGPMKVDGSIDLSEPGCISGMLDLEVDGPAAFNASWTDGVDGYVRRVCDLLSLANGRFVDWSVRSTFFGDGGSQAEFKSPKSSPQVIDPVFHYLDPSSAERLISSQRAHEVLEGEGGGLAIEHVVSNPGYVEQRFSSAVLAIEHLLSKSRMRLASTLLPQPVFDDGVLPGLMQALERSQLSLDSDSEEVGSAAAQIGRIERKLRGLNSVTLRERLEEFLTRNGVPCDDLGEEIQDIIKARNKLFHTGAHEKKRKLTELWRPARELAVRILLALFEYEGQYQSWYPDHESREFRLAEANGEDSRQGEAPHPGT